MKVTSRELVLMLLTGGAALFGGTAILGQSRFELIKTLGEDQRKVRQEIDRSNRLIQSREHWQKLYDELGKKLPQFPADKKMDVHWLTLMDEVASRHGVVISKRQVGEEKKVGDVYELPIDVKEWDGKLDAIVHFMFDLQREGVMLDLRQLYIKPKEDRSLRGRFTLYCAYMRTAAPGRPPKEAAKPEGAAAGPNPGT
jgi:Tfp pilus assembly protein PilO